MMKTTVAHVTIAGRISRDAEFRLTQAGKPSLKFSIPVGGGDRQQWYNIQYFGADAAEMQPSLTAQTPVTILGNLNPPRIYTRNNGENAIDLTVFANSIILVGGIEQGERSQYHGGGTSEEEVEF